MKKSLYLTAALLATSVGLLSSCAEDMETIDNKVYSPVTNPETSLLLDGKANEMTRTLSARLALPVDNDVNITYAAAPELASAYNEIYSASAQTLPEENYSIPQPVATVLAGDVTSSEVEINFTGLLDLDQQSVYVLPVKIASSDVEVMESSRTTYFVFRGAALINVVGDMNGTCLKFVNEGQTPELGNLTQLTFEALVYPDEFPGQGGLSTLMGIEGVFLIRIGDAGVPPSQLQLATSSGNATDTNWKFDTGKWTFLTVTFDSSTGAIDVYFDGVKKGDTQYVSYRRAVNWNVSSSDRGCYIGYAYDTDRGFRGKMSQVRVWNKILTSSDINERNHFYTVDEEADGLVFYLKFDEGSGNTVHDYVNGYDMYVPATYPGKASVPGDLGWMEVTMP